MRTRLRLTPVYWDYAAQIWCHPTSAALRWTLNSSLEIRCLWKLKWLQTEEWTAMNFCWLRSSLNLDMARSRRRNVRWEFLALLFSHRPTFWAAWLPMTVIAARYDFSRSVTMIFSWPYRFIAFLKNVNAARRSRCWVTKNSRISPSSLTAR